MLRPPPTSTLFPYTTLFRSVEERAHRLVRVLVTDRLGDQSRDRQHLQLLEASLLGDPDSVRHRHFEKLKVLSIDRKSTRLNSSHITISYAVFCLKKKKKTILPHLLHNQFHLNNDLLFTRSLHLDSHLSLRRTLYIRQHTTSA